MGDIVNLRRARKRKAREADAAAAAINRAQHGRSGSEKRRSLLLRELDERRIEAHRRDGDAADPTPKDA